MQDSLLKKGLRGSADLIIEVGKGLERHLWDGILRHSSLRDAHLVPILISNPASTLVDTKCTVEQTADLSGELERPQTDGPDDYARRMTRLWLCRPVGICTALVPTAANQVRHGHRRRRRRLREQRGFARCLK